MSQDGMMIDHLRTAGILFRRGLLQTSTQPIVLKLGDEPNAARIYPELMRAKIQVRPGWQDIHAVRSAFVPASDEQAKSPWLTQAPPNPLVSDTGQIIKDIDRKQLTVAAPAAEAFSGFVDGRDPAGLQHLRIGESHFATVIAVCDDGQDLSHSERIIISRTGLDQASKETEGPLVQVRGIKAPAAGQAWRIHVTRPASAGPEQTVTANAAGELALPAAGWRECELQLH
jgi:hypothetical protein